MGGKTGVPSRKAVGNGEISIHKTWTMKIGIVGSGGPSESQSTPLVVKMVGGVVDFSFEKGNSGIAKVRSGIWDLRGLMMK